MAKKSTTNKKKLRRRARAGALGRSKASGLDPVRFSLMAKPFGPVCNLRCRYCFYLEKDILFSQDADTRMSDEVLEAYIRKTIAATPAQEVAFHWQGGEPTMMGLAFYEKAIRLQQQYAGKKRIRNVIQTNGTVLDDSWGRFLAAHKFLVGLSLDGPADVHDHHRIDAGGRPTFDRVMRGMRVLRDHGVEFNVLACVTPESCGRALEIYRFFRDNGVGFIQFMPIVERLPDEAATQLGLELAVGIRAGEAAGAVRMTPWSVEPLAYGEFLTEIFDEWVRNDVSSIAVMNFEWALAAWLDRPARVCQWMPNCGRSPIIEHNGDVYSCDHYVYPDYRLGNILTDDLQEMIQSDAQCSFGEAKSKALPDYCRECSVLRVCWGECPKRRFLDTPDGQPGLNYLCEGYKAFFTHRGPFFKAIAQLIRAGRPATDIMSAEVIVMPHAHVSSP